MFNLSKVAILLFLSSAEARIGTKTSPGERALERVVNLETPLAPLPVKRQLQPPKDPKEDKCKEPKDEEAKKKCDKKAKGPPPPKDHKAPPPPPGTTGYANNIPATGYQSANVFTETQTAQQQQQAIEEIQQATAEMQNTLNQMQQQTQQNTGNQKTQYSNQQAQSSPTTKPTKKTTSPPTKKPTSKPTSSPTIPPFKPAKEDEPVPYTGKHVPQISSDLLTFAIDCVADCDSGCTMFSVNTVYFDGVLDLNFKCLEKCMADKQSLCSNVALCQSKC